MPRPLLLDLRLHGVAERLAVLAHPALEQPLAQPAAGLLQQGVPRPGQVVQAERLVEQAARLPRRRRQAGPAQVGRLAQRRTEVAVEVLPGQVDQLAVGRLVGLVRQRQQEAAAERRVGVLDRRLALVVAGREYRCRRGVMTQFGEGGVGVAQRQHAGPAAVHGRQQQQADHVGLGVAHLPQHGPQRVGQVEEDAAAGAAGQVGDDVDARPVGAHAEARLAGGGLQGGRVEAGVQLHLQAADDGAVVVAEGQPAQGAHAGGHLRARDAVEHLRVEPAVEAGPAVARLEVVAGPVERGQQHVAAGQGRPRPAGRGRPHHLGVGVEQQQAQVRRRWPGEPKRRCRFSRSRCRTVMPTAPTPTTRAGNRAPSPRDLGRRRARRRRPRAWSTAASRPRSECVMPGLESVGAAAGCWRWRAPCVVLAVAVLALRRRRPGRAARGALGNAAVACPAPAARPRRSSRTMSRQVG